AALHGTITPLELGQVEGGGKVTILRRLMQQKGFVGLRPFLGLPAWRKTLNLFRFVGKQYAGWGPTLGGDLKKAAAGDPGFTPKFGGALRQLVQQGVVPAGMAQHAGTVGEVASLWFGEEIARGPANLPASVMNLELMEKAGELGADEEYRKRLAEKNLPFEGKKG